MNQELYNTLLDKYSMIIEKHGKVKAFNMLKGAVSAYKNPRIPAKAKAEMLMTYRKVFETLFKKAA